MTEYFNLLWIVSSIFFGLASVSFFLIAGAILDSLRVKEDYFCPFMILGIIGSIVLTFVLCFAPVNDFYRCAKPVTTTSTSHNQ